MTHRRLLGMLVAGLAITAGSPAVAGDREQEVTEVKIRDSETLRIRIGHQKSLMVSGLKRVAVGDPKVVDVTVLDGREILVTGVGEGTTSLIIWTKKGPALSYMLKVADKFPDDIAAELKQLL
jgi:pilus assembly protein CpaC